MSIYDDIEDDGFNVGLSLSKRDFKSEMLDYIDGMKKMLKKDKSINVVRGDGLTKNTAKTKDIAVKACSPPDNKDIDCNLFPGGEAYISKPASSGSSESTSSIFAVPPLNSFV